jgi:amidase
LTGEAIARAMQMHGELMLRMGRFQEKYEFLICAVSQVPPFDAKLDWPHEINGVKMETYLDWMKSAYWITPTFCPAISVPAGFTATGLPVGMQIVGRYRDDLSVLQLAHAFEQVTGFAQTRPSV